MASGLEKVGTLLAGGMPAPGPERKRWFSDVADALNEATAEAQRLERERREAAAREATEAAAAARPAARAARLGWRVLDGGGEGPRAREHHAPRACAAPPSDEDPSTDERPEPPRPSRSAPPQAAPATCSTVIVVPIREPVERASDGPTKP